MKKIKTYNNFIGEGVRDKMTPKPREEVEKIITKLKEGGEVHVYEELIGKTLTDVDTIGDTSVDFTFDDGTVYSMYNEEEGTGNDCQITLEDINGELLDLVGEPLTMAEEVINEDKSKDGTWTFYRFATIQGYVDFRWYGESNGYYSERVSFRKIK